VTDNPEQEASRAMTPEEKRLYVTNCCDGFKQVLLMKANRILPAWGCAGIQQWIMGIMTK
jgi:hypothetical protein